MIELRDNSLLFSFPEVHPGAKISISFQRTLRIPDDGKPYPLPPGLGRFPLEHVDDYASNVPAEWIERGGVLLPMYQSEALWLNFESRYIPDRSVSYPFVIKVAAGKINAVTGDSWGEPLRQDPQDYMVSTRQPWLDGYCVEKGLIRQFVAMPLGDGYTAEEQLTGEAVYGGIQILAYPMKREAFEKYFPKKRRGVQFSISSGSPMPSVCESVSPMGLAPGGRMRQEIYEDPFRIYDWETGHKSRCFVHIANSLVWRALTGKLPPTVPFTAREYSDHGLPWFEYYRDDSKALGGSSKLGKLLSVVGMGKKKGGKPLPENESVITDSIIHLRQGLKEGQVREGEF